MLIEPSLFRYSFAWVCELATPPPADGFNGEELAKSVRRLELESGLVAAEGDSQIISVSLAVIFYAGRVTSRRERDTFPCG